MPINTLLNLKTTIIHKIFEKLKFSCEIAHYGKSLNSIFQEFLPSINKIFILEGRLALGCHSMKFRRFPDIS